jgi:hypothetical protein
MIPAMIVLMGNFSACATSNAVDADYVGLKEGFAQLARLIDTYSSIKVSVLKCPHAALATRRTNPKPHVARLMITGAC